MQYQFGLVPGKSFLPTRNQKQTTLKGTAVLFVFFFKTWTFMTERQIDFEGKTKTFNVNMYK